jgi:hypothetical protein
VGDESKDIRLKDYEKTMEYILTLTDVRFKLLAFVPLVSGLSLTILSAPIDKLPEPGIRMAIGLLGLMATCGIAVYDMRNTQLYHAAMFRARKLEASLNFTRFTMNHFDEYPNGGLITERAIRYGTQHDLGLSIVYGASISGWIFIILNSANPYRDLDIYFPYFIGLIFISIIILYYKIYMHVTHRKIQRFHI